MNKDRRTRHERRQAVCHVVVSIVLALLVTTTCAVEKAGAFSAVETLDLSTHGLMLREARGQLSTNPVFKNSGFLSIDRISKSEGVFKDVPWNPFPTQGGGPDVDGRSKYGDHYYNPRTGKGGAPTAVGKYFTILVQGMHNNNDAAAEQGAAWSAHFLADMCLPHHIVGIPAAEAEAIYIGGIDGRYPWNLKAEESGPLWLGTTPFANSFAWNAFLLDLYSKWPEWGTTQDFKRTIEAFHSLGSGGETGFRDWFDPWYYNGWGVGIDPFQIGPVVHNSSHAKWEVWAHLELTRSSSPYKATVYERFHPQWENAWLSFNEKVPWRAQQKQAQEFAKKAAQSTYDDMERIFKSPRVGVDDAIWRIMTLWRASITAMKVSLETKEDATNPARHQIRATVENTEKENVFDVKVRLTLTGDGSDVTETKDLKGGVQATQKGTVDFTVQPKDPVKCKVRVEVIGHYEKTPDLQYAIKDEPFKGIKKSQDEAQNPQLKDILDALRRLASRAEELAASISADCSSITTDLKAINADLDKVKARVESLEKQVRALEGIEEAIKAKAETIRQCHLDAERGAANEGQIAHRAEEYSKVICEVTKAIQTAKTKEERRKLFSGMQSTQADLRAFLTEGNSILELVRQYTRKAEAALSELQASTGNLTGASLEGQSDPGSSQLDRRLAGTKEKVKKAEEKLNELVRIREEAARKEEEGKKIIASWQSGPDKDKVEQEMASCMSRIDKARDRVSDCPGRCSTEAEETARTVGPVMEAYTKAQDALKKAQAGFEPGAIKKARDTANMVKYLENMTAAYMERIRRACTDGAMCFVLAEDLMKKPLYVAVPDVRGMHIDNAERTLRAAGFRTHTSILGAAARMDAEFKVQSQSPAGGGKTDEGSTITVYYYGQFNTRDAVANADCSRWPGSIASWDGAKKQAVCICPPGTSWTRNRSSCMSNRQIALNNTDCSRYPGAVPVFNEQTQRASCECPQGLKWSRNRSRCVDVETAALETADCSRFPGTRPVYMREQGRVDCFCPEGAMWDASKNRCISRQELDNYCNQIGAQLSAAARANDLRRFRELLPLAQQCDFYNQALADLQAMEYNRQVAAMNQMANAMGAMMGTTRPPQPPPVTPPTGGTGTTVPPVRTPTTPPAVTPVRPPAPGTTTTPPVRTPTGGTTTGSRSSVDCDKKYCPICGTDNLDMLRQSVSQQCMECRRRFAAQIADCNKGGRSAAGPGATVAQFMNHYVLQCVQQQWNSSARKFYPVTRYVVKGPTDQQPPGTCKPVFGPNTESQCNMKAQSLQYPRR